MRSMLALLTLATVIAAASAIAPAPALAQTPPLPAPPLPPAQTLAGDSPEQAFARGYQRGWADATERTQQRQRQSRPRACTKVTVLDATWIADRNACDATRAVGEIANGRATAGVPASNKLCGDPAPGRSKSLAVEFACGDPAYCGNEIRTASARESGTLRLDCSQ